MMVLLFATLSVTTATDINDNSTTITQTTHATDTSHVIENLETNKINKDNYNSGLDTSNSATTNSIGEKNTSQTSNSSKISNDATTNTQDQLNAKTNQKPEGLKASATYTPTTWYEFRSIFYDYNTPENITIELVENGVYTITDSLTFSSNYNIKNVTIIGNNATFTTADHQYRFMQISNSMSDYFIINITNVTFQSLGKGGEQGTGISGGVFTSSSGGKFNLSIDYCTFEDSQARNGAVFNFECGNDYNRAHVTINNSKFMNSYTDNHAGVASLKYADLVIDNSEFINSTSYFIGGTLFMNSGKLNVTNSVFDNGKSMGNKPYTASYDRSDFSGSAIHICSYDDTYIANNTFKNNYAVESGAIAFHKTGGGYDKQGTISIINNTFLNNSAAYGAAIGIFVSQNMVIANNSFINNSVFGRNTSETAKGGALYLDSTVRGLTFENNSFENNSAYYGGAVYAENNLASTNNTFVGNNATYGGALAVKESTARLTGISDTYENNTAVYGGAVYGTSWATIISKNGTFNSNNATFGGVAYIGGESQFNTECDVFDNNTATRGGVFYVNNTDRSIEAEGSNYTNNKATEYGGVLYVESGFVDSDDETYSNNTALIGGAIYNLAGTVDSINNNLINNSAEYGGAAFISENGTLIKQAGTDINNTAIIGGAIYNNGTLRSTGSTFEDNNATIGGALFNNGNSIISTDTFKNNNATLGGAVYNNATLSTTSNTFIGNNATNGGGILDNGTLSGTGNNYYNNTALENGGGVYSCADNNVVIEDITFEGNVAGQNGGAIYTENNVIINSSHDVKYINNSAVNGGAVYLSNASNLITSGDEFIANNATLGGAVYASANNTVVVKTKTIFDSNNATNGAAVYLSDSTVLNSTSGVYKNGNAVNGSAIYAQQGSEIVSTNNEFTGNNADYGAVYFDEGVITTTLSNNNYTDNTAKQGAAIYTKSDINTTSVSFTGNNATLGGAIYLDGVTYNSNQDTFTSNNATNGGAIYSDNSLINLSSTFTKNDAEKGGVIYLDGSSVVNSTGSTYQQNNANLGGVYYVDENANVNVDTDSYTTNTATDGAVFYNKGNVTSTGTVYTKGSAENGGVLYNDVDAVYTSTKDVYTSNNAVNGAVIVNEGNVTITESIIDSNTGTNSVILNNKILTLTNNNVSKNVVTSDDGYVILNNVDTATIVDNLFDSNTDFKRDMLLGEIKPQSITGNTYISNYLNDTFEVPDIVEIPLDVLEYYVNITLNLSDIYNDTVRNGTITFYDENFKIIGRANVENGNASVRIYRVDLDKSVTNVTVVYQSIDESYQPMKAKTEVHLGKPTRIVIDPINQTYVDDKVNVTVRLYEVETLNPLENANITVYINGTKYTGNTADKGYIVIPDISFNHTGNYLVNATFEGNSTHEYRTVNATIPVVKVPTHLNMSLPTNVTHPDDQGYINVTLYDSRDNSTISAFNITLNVTGKSGYVALPDENGNISYLFTAYESGHIQVVASVHESNDKYLIPSEIEGELFIERYHTHFHSNNTAILIDGNPTNITFTLYDIEDTLIANKEINVTIYENGEEISSTIVNTGDDGTYTVSYVLDANDNVTITAYCTDNYKYRNSSLPVHLIAGKNSTWVAVSPENTYVNRTTNIRIDLSENGNNPFTGNVTLTVGNFEPVTVEVINGQINYTNDSWTWPEFTNVPISVSYEGDENHTDSSTTSTFTVFRAGTNTTIDVIETLDTNTVIVGNVTSEGYGPINIGNVTITAEYTNITTGLRETIDLGNVTVVNGEFTLTTDKLEVLESDYGGYDIKAKYNTNNVFYESQASTGTIKITSFKNTTIKITNNPSTIVGTQEGIVFSLHDNLGEPLANKTLIITINGTDYVNSNQTTDNNGRVIIYTSFDHVALNNISAIYEGDNYYNTSSSISNITVKQRTITIVTVPSPIHVYDNITINITLKDIDGNPIADQNITVSDQEHQGTYVTNENGTVSIDVIYTSYGIKNVTAEYLGSLFYIHSNSTDIIQVLRLDTILNVTAKSPVIIGNVTKIEGYLVLHNGTPIANAIISMYINNATEAISLTTDENGYYYYNYTTELVGKNNVRVVFEDTNAYWGFEDSQAFIVKKYITDISVSADKLIKVGESTNITGILEDEFGNILPNKLVNLTVNGEVVGHDYTDVDGSYKFTFTQPKSGLYNITVNFTGDNKYTASFDTYQIKVDKVLTHINITGTSPVNYGDLIEVTGVLFDEYDNLLARQNITVYINGTETANITSHGAGYIEYSYNANATNLQNITFKFNGTDMYYESNNTYQVNVLRIYTHFMNLNASNVELGQNSTIMGYLVDETGKGLKNTEFNVTLNDNESTTKTVTTDNEGYFNFEYNSTVIGINTVTLSYAGNYSHEAADDYVTFTVEKLDVFIEANVTNAKAGNTTILVNVTDEEGNPIPEGTVLILYDEDDEPIGSGRVNENGTVEISVPLEPGIQDLIIVYNGTDDLYKYASTILTVNIPKYVLNLTINDINDTKVRNSTNITGFLFYEDLEENPISGENVKIYVDGIEIATVQTGEDGNYSYQYDATTSGFKEVLVVYESNDTHSRIETTSNFTVVKINTNMTIVDIANVTVDDNSTITGVLLDEFGLFIPEASLTIEINGINYTSTTDENGVFSHVYTTSVIGVNNITVYYGGNDTFNVSVNMSSFNVTMHSTNVSANISNPLPGRNLVAVNVTDEDDNNVVTGSVVIKENDEIIAEGIIVDGKLVTVVNLEPGNHTLVVEYLGIPNYAANSTEFNVTIPKYGTTIVPEAVNIVKLNDTVVINGTLVDEYNNPVASTEINISINGVNVTVPVNEEGFFTYTSTANITGLNNVSIIYEGNDTYADSNASFNFTVVPIYTQISANATSPIIITNNTTISIILKDEKGNSISGALVEIWINGKLNQTVTMNDVNYDYEVPTDTLGLNNVTVIYRGNENYTAVNATTNFLVDKMFTAVNVSAVSPIKVGANTTVGG
ncbi:MAG: hypothetical protein E7Z84_01850, partial [Methanosphaera stadtmanae]|nr:hypothetical protein [Methanosphaera stadtmanae]